MRHDDPTVFGDGIRRFHHFLYCDDGGDDRSVLLHADPPPAKINDMLNNLKVGDRVKTIGGLYGRIVRIKDEVVIVEVGANKVEMPFSRRAIGTVEDADVENEL